MIGRFCIIRTQSAGVHMGFLKEIYKTTGIVLEARRLWRWRGANTLNEVSLHGVSMEEFTKISEPVDEILLTEIIEVIPCSEKAEANLKTSRWLE